MNTVLLIKNLPNDSHYLNLERSFCMTKPGLNYEQILEVISLIYKNNFIIERLRFDFFEETDAFFLYNEHKQKSFFNEVIDFMCQKTTKDRQKVCFIELFKHNCIEDFRILIGATDPAIAAKGTIRNKFGINKMCNAIHGSATKEDAYKELDYFFPI